MARKRVVRSLTKLPERSAVGDAEHKTARLLEILRNVAASNQQQESQPFYSLREVATRFGVPLSMVSRTYRQLETEGILSRIRGSKTTLQGLRNDRRIMVRGFVALPASESAFITLYEYRTFFKRMKRELRLRGFAAAQVFFTPAELKGSAFADRLSTYQIDTVLWFLPPKGTRETVQRLSDLGIRVLGISEGQESVIRCRYEIHRETAIRDLLSEWKSRHSVNTITLAESRQFRHPSNDATLQRVCDDLGVSVQIVHLLNQTAEVFIHELRRSKSDAIVFPSSELASFLCFRNPEAVVDLLKIRRIGFVDGSVTIPFSKTAHVHVDLVSVNWQLVSESIVNDLVTQRAFQQSDCTIFDAQSYSDVSLREFSLVV